MLDLKVESRETVDLTGEPPSEVACICLHHALQCLMVCKNDKRLPALQELALVFDGLDDGEQFLMTCLPTLFCLSELARPESNRMPLSIDELREDSTNTDLGGIRLHPG